MHAVRYLPFVLCLALSPLASVTGHAAEDNESVVGRSAGVKLSAAEARRLLSVMGTDARKQLQESPADLEKLLRAELVRRAVLAEARAKGFDRKSEIQYLMERGREQALVSAFVQSQVRPPADFPAEDAIKATYDANKESLSMPAQYRLARIAVLAPAGDKAKAEAAGKKAMTLAEQLQKDPERFAQLAKENSDHKASAGKGGEIGWVPENRLAAEVRGEVAKLAKGAVSPAIRTRDGWNIMKVLDITPRRARTLEEARPLISAGLRQRWTQENEKIYLENLMQKSPPQLDAAEVTRLHESLQK